MSVNCVDAIIEVSQEISTPLLVIPSRRQIDNEENGGGYVNNWTTEEFSNYLRSRDSKNNIILCRDHGGPWQGNLEFKKKLKLSDAMASAKRSFEQDIDADFKIIHIDPSVHYQTQPTKTEIV